MSLKDLLPKIEAGVALVEQLSPLISSLGIPGVSQVSAIAGGLADLAQIAQQAVADGKLAATTQNQAELDGLQQRLQAENDILAAKVAAS